MKKVDMMGLVWTNLWRMKFRTILTTVGVIIGTGAIVTMVSLGVGLQERVTKTFSSMGDLTEITVSHGYDMSSPVMMGGQPRISKPLDEDAVRDIEEIDGVVSAMPKINVYGGELSFKRYKTGANLIGIDPSKASKFEYQMAEGKFLGHDKNSVVVGYNVPNLRMENNKRKERKSKRRQEQTDPHLQVLPGVFGEPAQRIDILRKRGELTFHRTNADGEEETKTWRVKVVGILAEKGGMNDHDILMSDETVSEILDWMNNKKNYVKKNGYEQVLVKVKSPDDIDRVQKQIQEMGYMPMSTKQILQGVNKTFVILQAVLGGIGAIALLVASLGIMNTMVMSIYERTKEIGVMKVIGATIPDIKKMFLMEAGTIGFIGGVAGVVIGWLISKIINFFVNIYIRKGGGDPQSIVSMPLWLALFAIGFAVFVGLVSGLYPALKAARLSPLTAIRQE